MTAATRLRVGLLLSAILAANASYTVLIPFVPELESRLGLDHLSLALVFALFAGCKVLAQPVGGWCTDRWQARTVAVAALALVAVCVAVLALTDSKTVFLIARSGWGVGEGLLTPALYHGATLLSERYGIASSRMMGWFGTASVTGFLIGPVAAGFGASVGLVALCLIGAAVTLLTAVGLRLAIPVAVAAQQPDAETPQAPTETVGTGWLRLALVFGTLDLIASFSYTALEPTIPLYLAASANPTAAISVVFALGLATFAIASSMLGRVVDAVPLPNVVIGGLALGAAGLAALSVSNRPVPVATSFILIMISQAMLYLAARTGIARIRAASGRLGRSFGVFGAISDLGDVAGPLAGMALFGLAGRFGFAALGVVNLVTVAVIVALLRRETKTAALVAVARPLHQTHRS